MKDDHETSEAGIYSLYLAGVAGNGFGLILMRNGIIAGSDSNGTTFDGSYSSQGATFIGSVTVTAPAGTGNLIQGVTVPPQGLVYEVKFELPRNFALLSFVKMPTPYGDLNVRFVKIRTMQ